MSDDTEEEEGPEDEEKKARRRQRALERAAVPSVYIDDWSVLTWEGHIRIVLGEWLAGQNNYRFAMAMTTEIAEEFAEYILERVAERKKRDALPGNEDTTTESEP
jgi:hypothetical protein